jgi:4-amino-4-deoxy-L-arabinose transferase-like glycosyltransferase
MILGLTLLAFGLRLWHLDSVPPGWRDDELINSLVISQKVLDGELAVYYPDASGHEALFHALNAIMLGLFGPGILGIRLLSVFLGTLSIPLTWQVGRRLLGSTAGLVAAAGLALSFWSLMYSRIGLRHVLLPPLVAGAFYFFWQGLQTPTGLAKPRSDLRGFLYASLAIGLGFYTYFAARGLPLILAAFCIYLWFSDRVLLKKRRRPLAIMFGALMLLSLPLLITLAAQPESESRVAELALPLVEARAGNLEPIWNHVRITLNMFHSDGDGEWLYNIPNRPLFGLPVALSFWLGVGLALWYTLLGLLGKRSHRRREQDPQEQQRVLRWAHAGSFLLLWWLAGISPAFISVPPASLGHTIMAQPAVFILAALPVQWLAERGHPRNGRLRGPAIRRAPLLLALLLPALIGLRDLPDYFDEWPRRGMVRFLYRADIRELAEFLNEGVKQPDFGIAGLLAGPWDRVALEIDLNENSTAAVRPRWFNPQRAIMLQPPVSYVGFPNVNDAYANRYKPVAGFEPIGSYQLSQAQIPPSAVEATCFENGLCWVAAEFDAAEGRLELEWLLDRPLELAAPALISNPPPPGTYAGPRLLVFGQLHDESGDFLVGDDGLWVDPQTLQPGDQFRQQHWLVPPAGTTPAIAAFGLYDPLTGERLQSEDGRDHLILDIRE